MGGNGTYINTLRFRFGDVTPQGDWIPIGFPFPLFFLDKNTRKAPIYRSWNLRERSAEEELGDGNSLFFFGADQPETQEKSHVFYGLNSMLIPDAQESSWTWLLTINSKALGKKKSYIFINQQVASIAPEKKKKNNNTPRDAAAVTFFYPQTLEVTFSQPLKSVRNKHPKKGYRQSIASQYLFSPDVSPTCVESFGWWEFLVQKVV